MQVWLLGQSSGPRSWVYIHHPQNLSAIETERVDIEIRYVPYYGALYNVIGTFFAYADNPQNVRNVVSNKLTHISKHPLYNGCTSGPEHNSITTLCGNISTPFLWSDHFYGNLRFDF